jgi:hypothetical protein
VLRRSRPGLAAMRTGCAAGVPGAGAGLLLPGTLGLRDRHRLAQDRHGRALRHQRNPLHQVPPARTLDDPLRQGHWPHWLERFMDHAVLNRSAARSAMAIVIAWVFARGRVGITEASTT